MENVWAIILAAGTSTRMKRQKMLLPFRDKTIIETVIENIMPVFNKNILVVLGSHRYEISRLIHKLPVRICVNDEYTSGMLSSVIYGFRGIPEGAKAAMIFLGDQPQIPGEVSQKISEAWTEKKKGIVIPVYNRKRGHPTLIETRYREDIEKLDPNKGLRQLMDMYNEDIFEMECLYPEILRDIDTPDDYEKETQ